MGEHSWVTRGLVFPLDVSPSEERLLVSYCGARRFAYNWVLGLVRDNLAVRRAERATGVPEDCLTQAQRLLDAGQNQQSVAGLRPETKNADRRRHKTSTAKAGLAAVA